MSIYMARNGRRYRGTVVRRETYADINLLTLGGQHGEMGAKVAGYKRENGLW